MDKTTVREALTQLTALGFEYGDEVRLGLYAKPERKLSPRKGKGTMPLLPLEAITKAEVQGRSIYFCVNGDYKNEDVKECRVLFYEHDDIPKEESKRIWQSIGLPEPTLQVDTGGKSIHTYYLLDKPIDPILWRTLQQGFIHHLKSDDSLHNPGRVMRLAGSVHPDTGNVGTIVTNSGHSYPVEIFTNLLAIPEPTKVSQVSLPLDDIEEARVALKAINTFEYIDSEYHWHRVGMACKYISESLFDDWVQWSMTSPKSVNCDFRTRWDSWKGNGLRRATLFQYAKDCGWRSNSPKYQPSPTGSFDHLDEVQTSQRSAFGTMVDKVCNAVGNRLIYNSFTCKLMFDGEERPSDYVSAQIQDTLNIDIPRRMFDAREIIKAVAQRNQIHPILDYLKSCKPNPQVSHLNVATKYLGSSDPVEDEYFAAFLKAAVLRQIDSVNPTEYHFILVLLGATGCGKTSTFKLLFKTWYYTMCTLSGNDWKEGVAKTWLCFWDELSPILGNKKHAEINGFITQSQDFYHELYETKAKPRIRPFVIGGTTTETTFLLENPSLRRFNVIKMGNLDRESFEKDVDAIWASAYASVLSNPVLPEVSTFAEIEARNQEFIEPTGYDSIIEKLVNEQWDSEGYIWVAKLVEVSIQAKIPIPNGFVHSIESYLKQNGFEPRRTYNVNKRRIRAWFRK